MDLIITSFLLGIGLAMDAFSVSLANGMYEPQMKKGRMSCIAGVYAVFQGVMPMIGWVCVHTITEYFKVFEALIPWIALILLLFIGGKMIAEGIRGGEVSEEIKTLGIVKLLIQGVATSIDALSVGFAIAEYNAAQAMVSAAIIAIVTFVICVAGLILGKKIGMKLTKGASILGGLILIGIGIKIFIEGGVI